MKTAEKIDYILKTWSTDKTQYPAIQLNNMNRSDLASLFKTFDYKVGAEIGTYRGDYAKVLCEQNPDLKLYCIDPYDSYKGYVRYHTQNDLSSALKEADNKLRNYKVTIRVDYSIPASKSYEDNSLDFVYIDAAHDYRSVVDDIDSWYPKVKVGGIVSGHDWVRRNRPTRTHIIQAVKGFVDSYSIAPLFITDRPASQKNIDRDATRSWFFVKQKIDNEYLH